MPSTITPRGAHGGERNGHGPVASAFPPPTTEYIVGFPASEIPLSAGAHKLPCRRCGTESWYNPGGLRRIAQGTGIPLCGPCGFLFQQLYPHNELEHLGVRPNFESERYDRAVFGFT